MPPKVASLVCVRALLWVPPPHVAVHKSNALHAVTTQFTGHGSVLHTADWCVSGQECPGVALMSERVLSCVPPPHVLLQSVNSPHAPYTQLGAAAGGGHSSVSQVWDWLTSVGHAVPPVAAGVTTERDRVCVPPPHVTVQSEKEPQADISQLCWVSGQRTELPRPMVIVLQPAIALASLSPGHATPLHTKTPAGTGVGESVGGVGDRVGNGVGGLGPDGPLQFWPQQPGLQCVATAAAQVLAGGVHACSTRSLVHACCDRNALCQN